jgi:hypothetical protein
VNACARLPKRVINPVLLGIALIAVAPAAMAECPWTPLAVDAGYIRNRSEWREFGAMGQQLVHESGRLQGPVVSAQWRCQDWVMRGEVSDLDGDRTYDGQTNSGAPVTSHSAVRQQEANLQLAFDVTDNWQLGGKISDQTLWRDIASSAGAAGYPEKFNWTLIHLGAHWHTGLGPGRLTMALWLGVPVRSSLSVRLPGRDELTLALGAIHHLEATARWRMPLRPAWELQIELSFRRTVIAQGDAGVVRRAGVPVAVARQPQTHIEDMPFRLGVSYVF